MGLFSLSPGFNLGSDPDVENFIDAAGLTSNTQKYALRYLVWGLKNFGLWDKMQAVYPFLSDSSLGTYPGYKYNLINPADSDAAFRLIFSNITLGASAVTPGATGGVADTQYVPNVHGSLNDQHIAFYSLTNGNNVTSVEMGAGGTGTNGEIKLRLDNGTEFIAAVNSSNAIFTPHPFSDNARGLFVASRTSNTEFKIYRNGVLGGTSDLDSGWMAEVSIYIFANHLYTGGVSSYSTRASSFASIGRGLTAQDTINYNTIVQNFLTLLGRTTY